MFFLGFTLHVFTQLESGTKRPFKSLKKKKKASMYLYVLVAPTSTVLQQHVQAGIGHTAHLLCRFTGHPDSISWYHGHTGAPVVGSRYSVTRYIREDSGAVDSRLSIDAVTGRDYGAYRCKASNIYSSTDALVFLTGILIILYCDNNASIY